MRNLAAALALSLLLPSGARAQTSLEPLEQLRELVTRARFEDAVRAATELLARPGLSAGERNSALELLATAQIANRAQADADRTLAQLYSRDPGHRLSDPDPSPPVIAAFARARESRARLVEVALEHTPPRPSARESPQLRVRVAAGASAVAELELTYRLADEGATRVLMTPHDDGTFTARVPVLGDRAASVDVAYFIVARAPSRAPLAQLGSEAEPLQLRIPAEASRRETAPRPGVEVGGAREGGGAKAVEQWWFWVLIAALVGAGVTTGAVVAAQRSPEEGTLGTARLMQVEW